MWNLVLQEVHLVRVVHYQVAARVQVADQVPVVQGQAVLRVQAVQACPVAVQVVRVRVVLHNIYRRLQLFGLLAMVAETQT